MPFQIRRFVLGFGALALVVIYAGWMTHGLAAASSASDVSSVTFQVQKGAGFMTIIKDLHNAGLIRSSSAAVAFALLSGKAPLLKPGSYRLSPTMSAVEILSDIAAGEAREVTVTIPEGKNLYEIDAILADALVLPRGALIAANAKAKSGEKLEGKLFPDTYRFFTDSNATSVVEKFLDNFNEKAAPLLAKDAKNALRDLIVASLLEKEVTDAGDRRIVAGIIWKRESIGMALQIDATLCYALQLRAPTDTVSCASLDTKINSPYNTYLNKGFPPAPIGNPGTAAIEAAISPERSPYWYYLSDPKTGKTIFAKTLDEHHQNTVKYLKGN